MPENGLHREEGRQSNECGRKFKMKWVHIKETSVCDCSGTHNAACGLEEIRLHMNIVLYTLPGVPNQMQQRDYYDWVNIPYMHVLCLMQGAVCLWLFAARRLTRVKADWLAYNVICTLCCTMYIRWIDTHEQCTNGSNQCTIVPVLGWQVTRCHDYGTSQHPNLSLPLAP